jgi:hypothetical protein
MRRSSYLSRIARVDAKSRLLLTPARVLFRPPPLPIPDRLRAERPAIFPTEVTPVEPRWGGDPLESTRNFTLPSKPLVPVRDTSVAVAPKLALAPLSRPPVAESYSTVTPGGDPSELTRDVTLPSKPLVPSRDTGAPLAPKLPLPPVSRPPGVESFSTMTPKGEKKLPLPQVSRSMPASDSARSLSAKTALGISVNGEPSVVSAKPTSGGPASAEPQFRVARDQAAPARPGRHPKARRRSSNEAVATFDSSSLDVMWPHQASQHRSTNVTNSATGQTAFSAAPVSKRASETSPTVLIPPLLADAEKRATVKMETGSGLRIGALEVRIMPPPPVTPPAPAAFLRQPGASRPHVALSRGFRSFGLTQS